MTSSRGADRTDGPNISRRTLVRGAAWAVPVVAVAAIAPSVAASEPPPTTTPTFISSAGCGTTGNGGGCAGLVKAPQIPFVIKNTTASPLWFQVTGMKSWQMGPPPTTWDTDYPNHYRLFTQSSPSSGSCQPEITTTKTCGPDTYLSVLVQPNQTLSLWLVGQAQGAASSFTMAVRSRWVYEDCTVAVAQTEASSTQISPSANCD